MSTQDAYDQMDIYALSDEVARLSALNDELVGMLHQVANGLEVSGFHLIATKIRKDLAALSPNPSP